MDIPMPWQGRGVTVMARRIEMTASHNGPRDRDSDQGQGHPVQPPTRDPQEPIKRSPDGSTPPRGVGDGEED